MIGFAVLLLVLWIVFNIIHLYIGKQLFFLIAGGALLLCIFLDGGAFTGIDLLRLLFGSYFIFVAANDD